MAQLILTEVQSAGVMVIDGVNSFTFIPPANTSNTGVKAPEVSVFTLIYKQVESFGVVSQLEST